MLVTFGSVGAEPSPIYRPDDGGQHVASACWPPAQPQLEFIVRPAKSPWAKSEDIPPLSEEEQKLLDDLLGENVKEPITARVSDVDLGTLYDSLKGDGMRDAKIMAMAMTRAEHAAKKRFGIEDASSEAYALCLLIFAFVMYASSHKETIEEQIKYARKGVRLLVKQVEEMLASEIDEPTIPKRKDG